MARRQGEAPSEWPLTIMLIVLALVAIAIVAWTFWAAAADDGDLPQPPGRPTMPPTPAVRVLPTATAPLVFHVPTPSPWPTFAADLLPIRPTSTRAPARPPTFTPMPTRTPTPDQGTRVPVQKG